jgi:hypothetical protein
MPVLSTLGAATAKAWGFLRQAAGGAADPYFDYVTMLLNGDGTNGAQNNTFLDSSTNDISVIRGGNATQGSFSPYGNLWSNYLNGSNAYLTISGTSSALALPANFTIEFWYYQSATTNYGNIFSTTSTFSTTDSLRISTGGSNNTLQVASGGGGLIDASTTFSANTWNHIALVRNGSTLTLYQNGVSVGSTTNSQSFVSDTFIIGNVSGPGSPYYLNGYLSNFRVVKGTAVYTTTFTPPTTPLTAITNTQLLTCQSNRFIDNSSNAFAITVNGTPSVQRFSPFNPTASYDKTVIGGSMYTDGSGDYIKANSSPAFALGSGDWTVQFWAYYTDVGATNETAVELPSTRLIIGRKTNGKVRLYLNGEQNGSNNGPTIPNNSWTNYSVARTGSTVNVYINGASAFSFSDSTDYSSSSGISVGRNNDGQEPMIGYVSDVRVLKGTYNVTLPTSPYTAITNTQFLASMTNAGIPDYAMMNDLETVGNAQVSTSVIKYGTGSIKFDGTGDYLQASQATNVSCAFGTGDFTIEMWAYINSFAQYETLIDFRGVSQTGYYPCLFFNNSSGTLVYYVNDVERITVSSNLSTGTWYHIAVCRSGTSTKLFINGTQSGSTWTDTSNYVCGTQRPAIGTLGYLPNYTGSDFNGYIDDLRITKGYARYTSNFTVPDAALPTY